MKSLRRFLKKAKKINNRKHDGLFESMKKWSCIFILKLLRVFRKWFYTIMDKIYFYGFGYRFKSYGKGVNIHFPSKIHGRHQIEIGDNVHINRNAFIRGNGGLIIEDNVHIARNFTAYTLNHNYEGGAIPYDNTSIKRKVIIEKNVWIGINVTIVPGTRIGYGSIIGAGTVVSKDVTPLSIVGGSPQKILKKRDASHYNYHENAKLYGGKDGKPFKQ